MAKKKSRKRNSTVTVGEATKSAAKGAGKQAEGSGEVQPGPTSTKPASPAGEKKSPLVEMLEQTKEMITGVTPASMAPVVESISKAAKNALETISDPDRISETLTRVMSGITGLEPPASVVNEVDKPAAADRQVDNAGGSDANTGAPTRSRSKGGIATTADRQGREPDASSTAAGAPTRSDPKGKGTATVSRGQVAVTPDSAIGASTGSGPRTGPPTTVERQGRGPSKPARSAVRPIMSESMITDADIYLFNEGTHSRLYEKLGAHGITRSGVNGVHFAVWAPNAERVSIIGDFNDWDYSLNVMSLRGDSGIWEGFIPALEKGAAYKYGIVSRTRGYSVDKADPFAFMAEVPPRTASVVASLDYTWNDASWMEKRRHHNNINAPMSIYEVHLGSWRRVPEEGNRSLTYREIAPLLAAHVKEMGFTHVELMPVMEHPFFGSWGYQITGFFAPSSRFGEPADLMYLIDQLHQNDIGVILDWVPSHFPTDEHGLSYFDGTHLYEHADPRQGFHPDWNSLIFNYGRNEVKSFLLSSAHYWVDKFHADGLRVDGVASMLYLDYSRKAGEWIPNKFGGRENLEAVDLLRQMNETVYAAAPGVQTIAEESTAWPLVSKPIYVGGLGFGFKWDMGWMHDTLRYMSQDPIHRRYHHNSLTFRMMYAYTENFVLSLSHDEVVHGKGSLIRKMPGDDWQKFANLRLLFAYMYAQPGKKLLFMGAELGTWFEWNHDGSLDWDLLDRPAHHGLRQWLSDLNHAYRDMKPFHELDCEPGGFEWIDCNDSENSIVSCIRRGKGADEVIIGVFNFTPRVRYNYQIGAPRPGMWKEFLNSDAEHYGGSAQGNFGEVEAAPVSLHGRPFALTLTLPPLGAIFLRPAKERAVDDE